MAGNGAVLALTAAVMLLLRSLVAPCFEKIEQMGTLEFGEELRVLETSRCGKLIR